MIAQILALIVALTVLYFLSRLRHFILARDKDKRRYYRAYIIGFDETDWGSRPDDNSRNEPDSKGATILHPAGGNSLKFKLFPPLTCERHRLTTVMRPRVQLLLRIIYKPFTPSLRAMF